VDSAHRKELKHDKFVDQVSHGVEYAAGHRSQMVKWGGAALALLLVSVGVYLYISHEHSVRQEALHNAMNTYEAGVGPAGNEFLKSFATQADKDKAVVKDLSEVSNNYSGKEEGRIARYFLGLHYADKGNLAEAEKQMKTVAESGKDAYASQAKLSLAQIYDSMGRTPEAEKLLRSLMDDPTILVSKEQATIALAKMLGKKNPAEARKLLEPLRTERGPVSRAAITALGELPAAR
jgi:predicted negative regulator of RcsB-dependent stress response